MGKITRRFFFYLSPVVAFVLATDFRLNILNTVHFIFQGRDLTRATELLGGNPIFFGPEMTGGGNLPGPLYYFLLAIPLSISQFWQTSWHFMMLLAATGGLIGWNFMRTRFSAATAAVWLVVFACSPLVLRTLLTFLNISFVFPFAIAVFVSLLWGLLAKTEDTRARAYFIGAFLTGLGIQLHFSVVTFLIGFWLSQIVAPWLKVERLSWRHLAKGVIFLLLPLIPFLLFRLTGSAWGQRPFFSGEAKDALPSLLLLIEFTKEIPVGELLLSLLTKIIETVPWPLFPILLAFWLVPGAKSRANVKIRPILFLTLISAIPFSYWIFATIGIRYSVPFALAATFLTAMLFHVISENRRRLEVYVYGSGTLLLFGFLYFVLYVDSALIFRDFVRLCLTVVGGALIFAVATGPNWIKEKGILLAVVLSTLTAFMQSTYGRTREFYSEPRIMPRVARWQDVWRGVYMATGWSYAEAMQRMYFVNHHLERDGSLTYASAVHNKAPATDKELPDGFFVLIGDNVEFESFLLIDIRNWLMLQNIPQVIKDGLASGDIELLRRHGTDVPIVSYKVVRPGRIPRYFHNNGQGYFSSEADQHLGHVKDREGVKILPDGRIVFKWNECPSRDPYCSTGAVVKVERPSANRRAVTIQVVGSALSQSSPWISPTWTQAWIKPYIEIRCRGREHRFPIAEAIGYQRQYSALPTHVLLWGNNSILAPYHHRFEFACDRNPTQITIGREGSEVETLYEVKKLPATELSVHL